jgi:hypothetical protein
MTAERYEMEIDMAAASELPPRGDELIRIFTRFEYALKEIGYAEPARNNDINVLWDKFVNEHLGPSFLEGVRDKGIAATLLQRPPSRQVIRNRVLDWEKTPPPTSVQDLFGAVRRVRNNLVHGGKSGDRDSDRNAALAAEAIAVLLDALRCHTDLRYMFENKW